MRVTVVRVAEAPFLLFRLPECFGMVAPLLLLFYIWGVPDDLRVAAFSLLACIRFPLESRLDLIAFDLVDFVAMRINSFSHQLIEYAKTRIRRNN